MGDHFSATVGKEIKKMKEDEEIEDPFSVYEGKDVDIPPMNMEDITDTYSNFELKMPF